MQMIFVYKGEDLARIFEKLLQESLNNPEYVPLGQELGRAGWMMHWTMKIPDLKDAVQVLHNGGPEALNDWFLNRFREHEGGQFYTIENDFESHLLVDWQPTLRELVWAYRHGRYTLVVPTAFTVVEGIIAKMAGYLRKEEHRTIRIWERRKQPRCSDNLEAVASASIEACLRAMYRPVPFSEPTPEVVNRHWVMHGRSPEVASRANALRLLLAIATLQGYWDWWVFDEDQSQANGNGELGQPSGPDAE